MEGPLLNRAWWKALSAGILCVFILAVLAGLILPSGTFSGRFWLFLVIAGAVAALATMFSTGAVRSTARDTLDDFLRKMAAGNLAIRRDLHTREVMDEYPGFLRVLRSFQSIIGYLQDTADSVSNASNKISAKAKALFTGAEEQVESVGQVRNSIAQLEGEIENVVSGVDTLSGFTEKTSSAILEMRASIEEVVNATHNLSSFVDEIGASIEEMARSVEEVAGHGESLSSFAIQNSSAMVQMDATIGQIEENIKETEVVSQHVQEVAGTGVSVVRNTVVALETIHNAMTTNLSAMDSLGERSKDIGKILKVIREIADQTNLLALNAAIIAAQAGEHGRSFGVVAEEIRDLSERTTASTGEVGAIIKTIQKEVDSAGKVAREGMVKVEEGLKLGRDSEENLTNISQAIETAGTSISHIARAASEQAKGSRQVTDAIEEMTKRIERISIATREQAKTSRLINQKAVVMKDLTRSVDRAMEEEAQGSNTIAEGMDQVRHSVEDIQKALIRMSQAGQKIMTAIDVISGSAEQNLHGARDLSGTSSNLKQDALLLVEELDTFTLPQAVRGGHIRVGCVNYDFNLDPVFANNIRDSELVHNFSVGLIQLGYGTQILPGLAESWELSTDGKVYTFTLRPNLTFHNGRRLTSSDVIYSWQRALSPKLNSAGRAFLAWVEGIDEFIEGKTPRVSGLSTPDDRTVEIRLKEPLAFFLYLLTTPEATVVPREAVDEKTDKLIKPLGCGPFMVSEHSPEKLVLDRFSGYFDSAIPYVDRLTFNLGFRTEEALQSALEKGDVHYVSTFSNDQIEVLLSDPFWQNNTESTVLLSTIIISIRNDLAPYNIKEVRQAFNYAVDRERLVSQYRHSKATPARGVLPPGIVGYRPSLKGYYYDPEKARWLLKSAGFPDGLDLDVTVDAGRIRQAKEFALLVDMLREVGIRIKTETVSHQVFAAREREHGRPGLYATGWYADYPDPDSFLYFLFYSKGGDSLELKYKNAELDELVERGRRTLDVEERIAIYQRAEDIVIEDSPCIVLYHSRGLVPHRPEISGMKLSLTPPMVRPDRIWLSSESES